MRGSCTEHGTATTAPPFSATGPPRVRRFSRAPPATALLATALRLISRFDGARERPPASERRRSAPTACRRAGIAVGRGRRARCGRAEQRARRRRRRRHAARRRPPRRSRRFQQHVFLAFCGEPAAFHVHPAVAARRVDDGRRPAVLAGVSFQLKSPTSTAPAQPWRRAAASGRRRLLQLRPPVWLHHRLLVHPRTTRRVVPRTSCRRRARSRGRTPARVPSSYGGNQRRHIAQGRAAAASSASTAAEAAGREAGEAAGDELQPQVRSSPRRHLPQRAGVGIAAALAGGGGAPAGSAAAPSHSRRATAPSRGCSA